MFIWYGVSCCLKLCLVLLLLVIDLMSFIKNCLRLFVVGRMDEILFVSCDILFRNGFCNIISSISCEV